MKKKTTFLLIFSFVLHPASFILFADPWGKDADLAHFKPQKKCELKQETKSPVVEFGVGMIRFHQQVISPCDGPRSSYYPSSSQYALNAIKKYGFCQGVAIGCDRLMRENDEEWVYRTIKLPCGTPIKYDPVR
jgi:putative component of membrane protein insertase Oxa1/YidC/SpoIIIJ protein YidD